MWRFLSAIFRWVRKPRTYWYAVKLTPHDRAVDHGWLVDLPRTFGDVPDYSADFGASIWYDSLNEAKEALQWSGMSLEDHRPVRLAIQANTNHYSMDDATW